MNAGFADASVHSISYDIDRELFNRLGHRSDEKGEEGYRSFGELSYRFCCIYVRIKS
jgi:hypothetical protein